ncbi:FtsQ-type POTRA domain-containing protein [Microbacterium sp. NPDC055683]
MRRPGPLPSSSRTEAEHVSADEARREAERRSTMRRLGIEDREPAREPEVDTAPIAVLRPAEPSAAGRDEPSVDGSDEPRAPRASVWRAARARRRALRSEVKRFTARTRRRRRAWLIGIGAVLAVVAASAGAAYSPLFAVERIVVEGADQLDVPAVEAALAEQVGTPLPLVDASAVKAALVGFPLIETYALEARPPHDLVVRVVERTPVGVVQGEAGFTSVDAAGVALATSAEPPAGLPLIDASGGAGSSAFLAAGQVVRSLPADLRARVSNVTATSPEDVAFALDGGALQVIWGSVEDSPEKASALTAALGAELPEGVTTFDVSAPGNLIVR